MVIVSLVKNLNRIYSYSNVSAESEIGMEPNPVYGMGTAGQEHQILSMLNSGYEHGTNGHMQ